MQLTLVAENVMIQLRLLSSDLDDERIDEITRSLFREIQQETVVEPKWPAEHPVAGAKGVGTVGLILFETFGKDFLAGVFNLLKIRVDRNPALEFELTKPDGSVLRFKAGQLNEAQFDSLLKDIKSSVKG